MEDSVIRVNEKGELISIDLFSGDVTVLQDLKNAAKEKWEYSIPLADVVCELVRQGKTYTEIANMKGMPSANTVLNWRHKYPDFAEKIRRAKVDRAELYFDRAYERAQDAGQAHKDDVPGIKAELEHLRWMMEKTDPEQFGSRTKVVGDPSAPLQIIVDTGIRRENPPLDIEAEGKEVEPQEALPQDSVVQDVVESPSGDIVAPV